MHFFVKVRSRLEAGDMDEKALRDTLARKDSETLLDIVIGSDPGFLPVARRLAEDILSDRGIRLTERGRQLKREFEEEGAAYESRSIENEHAQTDKWFGIWIAGIGALALVLSFGGLRFTILDFVGALYPIAAIAMITAGLFLRERAIRKLGASEPGGTDADADDEHRHRSGPS
jgi:hypothetical protein